MTEIFRDFVTAVFSRDDYYSLLVESDTFAGVSSKHQRTIRWMTGKDRARFLIGKMWFCMDIMPVGTCGELDLPQGSTYVKGARKLRSMLCEEYSGPTEQQIKIARRIAVLHEKQNIPLNEIAGRLV